MIYFVFLWPVHFFFLCVCGGGGGGGGGFIKIIENQYTGQNGATRIMKNRGTLLIAFLCNSNDGLFPPLVTGIPTCARLSRPIRAGVSYSGRLWHVGMVSSLGPANQETFDSNIGPNSNIIHTSYHGQYVWTTLIVLAQLLLSLTDC